MPSEQQAGAQAAPGERMTEEDILRAQFYALLANLLAAPPDAEMLAALRAMEGDNTDMGQALAALAAAAGANVATVSDDYTVLFYGHGAGGSLLPYASSYLTGFVYEKPLADLRADMERLGIAPSGARGEPEDHIAFLCEMMHGLIAGTFGTPLDLAGQKDFFDRHLDPWAGRFFADLAATPESAFYRAVGRVGGIFMAIEAAAFSMPGT
ncbi:MAG: molecular chaperone TorD family protein [Rhodobacterales bacterium]|nr:molecular chaperone TorD family protein [Rhodobacterales bacterium]